MKNTLSRAGREISRQTAQWIADSEARFKFQGCYATEQERVDAQHGIARLNRERQHARQFSLGVVLAPAPTSDNRG